MIFGFFFAKKLIVVLHKQLGANNILTSSEINQIILTLAELTPGLIAVLHKQLLNDIELNDNIYLLPSGLTPGLIAVLHKQLGTNDILTSDEIN